jgi:hypothetical protein
MRDGTRGDADHVSSENDAAGTSAGADPSSSGVRESVSERDTARREDLSEVLHPDVTFGVQPWIHIVFEVVPFALCALISIGAMLAHLPLQRHVGEGPPGKRWWPAVIVPQLVYLVIAIGFHAYCITQRERAIRMQIGPAPSPQTTSGGAVLQHSVLERVFTKQYVAANCSDIAVYASVAISAVVLFVRLELGQDLEWRIITLPFALGGLAAVITQTLYRVRCGTLRRICALCSNPAMAQQMHRTGTRACVGIAARCQPSARGATLR